MLAIPRPAERTRALDISRYGGIRGAHARVDYVHAVLVRGCGVRALPGGYAAAAAAQLERAGLNPGCAEAVEEVGLAG